MIVQVATCSVRPDREATFRECVQKAIDLGRAAHGLRYVKFARQTLDGQVRYCLIVEWATSRDLHAYQASEEITALLAKAVECIEGNTDLQWWEAVDVDFDPESWEPRYPEIGDVTPYPPRFAQVPA